jgi:hypothetical protein
MKIVTVKKKSKKINYKIRGANYLFFHSRAVKYIFGIPIKTKKRLSIYLDDVRRW